MRRDRSLSVIYLAVAFGCLYPIVELALEPYITLLAVPMGRTAREIGITTGQFKIINWGFWILVYTVVSGLIFGFPLGLSVRSNWFRAWVIFAVASVATRLILALGGEYGYSEFLSRWGLPGQWGMAGFWWVLKPETWTIMLGIALFVWFGYRIRTTLGHRGHGAP